MQRLITMITAISR